MLADVRARRAATKRTRVITLALLALALPTVVPALVVTWLMAKRWGRVEFGLIVADLVIMALVASRTSLFVPVLVSVCAAAALYVIRFREEPRGIALGFTGRVMTPAMIGGTLMIGACLFMQSRAGLAPHLERWWPATVDAGAVHELTAGMVVRVRPAEIAWDRALICDAASCVAGETPSAEQRARGTPLERWAPLSGSETASGRTRGWVAVPASAERVGSSRGVVRPREGVRQLLGTARADPGPEATVVAIGLEEPPALEPLLRSSMLLALASLLASIALIAIALWAGWIETDAG